MANPIRTTILAVGLALGLPAFGTEPVTPPPAAADDTNVAVLQQQLADTQEKLDAALHSYAELQDQNAQIQASSDKQVGPLRAQVQSLSEQVRQLRDQVADLAAENARLKTELALQAPSPAAAPSGPSKP
jgi:septal ring factor EnvC (AmiA/AmiB activator)